MQNDMRDRLVELIGVVPCNESSCSAVCNGRCEDFDDLDRCQKQKLADHLIANGVVVLDMKVLSPKNIPLVTHFANMPLDEVFELVKAKQQGKIIELPCNVQ